MSGKGVSEHEANKERGKSTLRLLRAVVETRNGAFREDAMGSETDDVRFVSLTMLKDGPLTRAVVINGELFVSALDAGVMDGRDRQRILVVARTVGNA